MSAPADFSPEFQAYGGWVAAAAIQQQGLFNDAVGSDSLTADLDARTLSGDRGVLGGVSLLGSFSQLDNTWLWSWANPGFGPDAQGVVPTTPIRDFGAEHGIGEFTTGSPGLSGFPEPTQAAITLAITAGSVLGPKRSARRHPMAARSSPTSTTTAALAPSAFSPSRTPARESPASRRSATGRSRS